MLKMLVAASLYYIISVMQSRIITCGRFDSCISFSSEIIKKSTAVRRIFAPNPNKIKPFQFTPISTDGHNVLHENGVEELDAFLARHTVSNSPPLIVLTNHEYLAALEKVSLRKCKLYVLEDRFPLFPRLRYAPSLKTNLATLCRLLRKVRQLGVVASSFSRDQSTRHLHRIARSLKFKSDLDRFFFLSLREGHHEVYKHIEERANRVVVALDFNSMFADCLRGKFCEPRHLKHRFFDQVNVAIDELEEGIYRVVLRGALPGFFLEHHPFLYRKLGRSFNFQLNVGDSVHALLHKIELLHFTRFFESVEVKEGFYSHKTIEHPLSKAAESLYARRRHARSRGDDVLEQFCKSSLQLMHSATNQRYKRCTNFSSSLDLRDFLESNFNISLDTLTSAKDLQRFMHQSAYFSAHQHSDKVSLDHIDIDTAKTIYCLSSGVLANARVKIIGAIERFLSFDSVEICYSNIDSVHISIDRDKLDEFLWKFNDLIGGALGQMKVEAIADRGYWFDVGRYWLFKGDHVTQFRNKGFNDGRSPNAFVTRRRAYVHHEDEAFSYLQPLLIYIEKSFSYTKKLGADRKGSTDFLRFSIQEIKTSEAMAESEAKEILRSRERKVRLLKRISGEAR